MNDLVADAFLAEKTAAITSLVGSVRRDIAEIGRHLSEVKEHFGRGDNPKFLAWASEAFGWSPATIYRYIEIFEFMRTGNFLNLRKLDLDLSSLYLLAAPSTTDEARAEVVEQATTGTKKLTHADVKRTVARHAKPKAKKAAPVVEAKVIEEAPSPESETEYRMVPAAPDATPPTVPATSDNPTKVEFLQGELAAAGEENEQLKSIVSDLKAQRVEDQNEIWRARMSGERLESRARDRVIDVSDVLAEMREPGRYNRDGSPHMVKFWKGLESLPPSMMVSKKELVLLLERRAAIEGAAAMTFHHDLDEGYRDDPPAQDEDEPAAEPEGEAGDRAGANLGIMERIRRRLSR